MSVQTSVEKLAQLKKDRVLATRFLKLGDSAAALVEQATGFAAPVRRDLKATNDALLQLLELQVQGEGFDGIKLVMGGKTFYMKRKNSRSAKVCRLTHLEVAYDSLTMAHLLAELESDEHATPTQLFCRAIIKRLRENEDLFSESQQLVLDTRPIEKKHGVEGPVSVADANQRVYELVQRRRELQDEMKTLNKQVADAKKRATRMLNKVDRSDVRAVVDRFQENGKQVRIQSADGRVRRIAATQKKRKPTVNVTTFDRGGLLQRIVDERLADVHDGERDDFAAWFDPDVKRRFHEACRDGIETYIEANTTVVDDVKTTKQRVKREPGSKAINGATKPAS